MGAECSHASVSQCVVGIDPPSYSERCLLNHALLEAARDGDHTRVLAAIHGGANLETRKPLAISCDVSEESGPRSKHAELDLVVGLTPLMLASKGGSIKCVRHLIEARAKIHATDEDGMAPLHFAAQAGEIAVAHALVEAGADVTLPDADDRLAFDYLPGDITKDAMQMRQWMSILVEPSSLEFGGRVVTGSTTSAPSGKLVESQTSGSP
mmetsp:Transcript_73035/g.136430  ORF Transcript_73035/g.136430 Transcript_73035/m.136430 type:complete len:210 (-) Transcript_73035:69-698(-)